MAIDTRDAFSYLDVNDEDLYGVKPPIQNTPVEDNLMAYNEHYNMLPEEEKPKFLNFLQNAGVNARDFLMDNVARYGGAKMGSTLATSLFGLNPITFLGGAIAGGIFGNRFTNQPYLPAVQGAYGYSADQLNKMNALGGYYSEPARAQRRQASRVANLIDRAESGKNFSRTNLKKLGGFSDSEIDNIVSGGTQISPGTFTAESLSDSFAGEEGPTGGSTSTATMDASDFSDDTAGTPFKYGGIAGLL